MVDDARLGESHITLGFGGFPRPSPPGRGTGDDPRDSSQIPFIIVGRDFGIFPPAWVWASGDPREERRCYEQQKVFSRERRYWWCCFSFGWWEGGIAVDKVWGKEYTGITLERRGMLGYTVLWLENAVFERLKAWAGEDSDSLLVERALDAAEELAEAAQVLLPLAVDFERLEQALLQTPRKQVDQIGVVSYEALLEAARQIKRLRELVRRGMTYTSDGDDEAHCIYCGNYSHHGHDSSCEAQAIIGR